MIVKFTDLNKNNKGKVYGESVDKINSRAYFTNANSLEKRLKGGNCELCGATEKIEIHHINKLKNLQGKAQWERAMIARKRKTLVVCKSCHYKIHNP